MKKADEIQNSEGLIFIQPFTNLGLLQVKERVVLTPRRRAELQSVYVPIGGGGFISGIATAIKLKSNQVRVIGVQPEVHHRCTNP